MTVTATIFVMSMMMIMIMIMMVVYSIRTMVNAAFTEIPEGAFSHMHLLQFL